MKTFRNIGAALLIIMSVMTACDVMEEPYLQGAESENAILEFRVDSVVGQIDETEKMVVLDFPGGTDVTNLVPTISVSPYATIEPASGVARNFSQPVYYTVTAMDGTEAKYCVTARVHDHDNEKSILSFSIAEPACDGVIDQVSMTVTLSFPGGTDITNLVPNIVISEGAQISPASGVAQDFTNPVEYTVTAMNGTTAVYTVRAIVGGFQGKKVLLKDFTGVRCVNCPRASELAHQLQETYGDQLIVMSVHAGFLAIPMGDFPDFRTDEGTSWYNSHSSNPLGAIDRTMLLTGYDLQDSQWEDAVSTAVEEEQTVEINVQNSFDDASRTVTTYVNALALTELSGNLALTVCLVEDNIVGKQAIQGGTDDSYVHRHVFRGTLNGADGQDIQLTTDEYYSASCSMVLPDNYNVDNCSIVAYVYDNSDNKKILQTVMSPVR